MKPEKDDAAQADNRELAEGRDRREFLREAAVAAAGIAAAASLPFQASAESSADRGVRLTKPFSWRLLNSTTKRQGTVKESTVLLELTGSNGARWLVDGYTKRIDHEGGHEDIILQKIDMYRPSDTAPANTETRILVGSTKFGELKDDVRRDEVTVQVIDQAGRRTLPPITVKVPIPSPYDGLSDQELVDKILSEKLGAQ